MTKDLENKLYSAVTRQLTNLFDLTEGERDLMSAMFPEAVDRTLYCFSHINNKYFQRGEINPLHSVQYTQFLYYCANTVFHGIDTGAKQQKTPMPASDENQDLPNMNSGRLIINNDEIAETSRSLCSKLYMLNKALSACEIYYEVELPDIFLLEHPVGTVMGRGKFSNYFFFLQNCTVGANNNLYPEFGERVVMCAGSKVLGTSHIGSNVIISADTCVIDQDVPDNSIVFGRSPNLIIKPGHKDKIDAMIEENFLII